MDKHRENSDESSDDDREESERKAESKRNESRCSLEVANPFREKFSYTPPQKKQCTGKPEEQFMPDVGKCTISDDNSVMVKGKFETFDDLKKELQNIEKSISNTSDTLKLNECSIASLNDETIDPIDVLKSIKFEKCDENIFKVFVKQKAIERIEVRSDDWTWNGFPHDLFNEICRNCQKLNQIVLIGAGTGSYFNSVEFPFKITKLEATMITFNWYVGIQGARVDFLESQKESLKELTIHELPYDFDGGKVLKFIIDEMKLKTFHYGTIPLILDGQKQGIKEFTASQIQITSAIEVIKQFKCDKFILKLTNSIISVEDIEEILNPSTAIFNSLKVFEVIDNSSGLLEVFSELYRKITGSQKITFKSNDKNVFKIIQQLPAMPELKEIEVTQSIPDGLTFDKFATDFKITKIMDNNEDQPQGYFGGNLGGLGAQGNAPGGGNPQQGNDEDNIRRGDGGAEGGGGGDGNNRNINFNRYPIDAITGIVAEGDGRQDEFHSTLSVLNLPQGIRNYYFTHPFGYPRTIFGPENVNQLETLLEANPTACNPMIESRGKISFKIFNDNQEQRDQIHNRIGQLAFIPYNKNVHLPLVTLPDNLLITVYCDIDVNMRWDTFLVQFPGSNNLSPSFWRSENFNSVPQEDGRFRMTFNIDGISHAEIVARGREFEFRGRRVLIVDQNNPFFTDIQQLPF